jgi:hypothetical protein
MIGPWPKTRCLAAVVLAGIACAAVSCRQREPLVAVLQEARGSVERSDGGGWTPAPTQAGFSIGDLLRTGAGAGAQLRLIAGTLINVGENARVRFLRGAASNGRPAPAAELGIDLGSAEIEQVVEELSLSTALGPLRIEKGTRLHVRSDGQTETIEVLVGRVILLEAGKSTAVGAGQGVRLKFGRAEVEHFHIKVGPAMVAPASTELPSARRDSAAPEGAARAPQPEQEPDPAPARQPAGRESEPPPDKGARPEAAAPERARADVTLPAGENAVLHDAKSALDVRLRFDHFCSSHGVVEVAGDSHRRLSGAGSVVLRIREGTQRYRLRCQASSSEKPVVVSGALRLLRDSGNLQLSRRAPFNAIEADGRHYTVLFQTRLPVLSFTWPAAPTNAGALKLNIDIAGQVKVFPTAEPRFELPSGALPEGTYTWSYTTEDGRQSPKTTVTIRFDNAAPTAQFFPSGGDDRERSPTAISINGVTLDGTKVSVAGQQLTIEDRGRFRTTATPAEGDAAVAVRLEHPRIGVHYYVRRPDPTGAHSMDRQGSDRR